MSKDLYKNWERQVEGLAPLGLARFLQKPVGLDFSSNDFLSLADCSQIRKKLISALKSGIPLSAGSSRLIRGHNQQHEQAEFLFQQWIGRPSALFFSSGYLANIGILSALGKDVVFFSDEFNHASLIDGCRLSGRRKHIYPHKNLNVLESLLKQAGKTKNTKVIITESVFSMDGDLAPLKELSELALKYEALLIVDEAHATGLYGKKGAGLCTLLKKKDHIISVHPCGKALSSSGAFVAGPKILKTYLINNCRPFIYSTAPVPLLLFQIQCVIEFLQKSSRRREVLKKKAQYFRDKLKVFADIGLSESAIVPVITGSNDSVLATSSLLQKKGYDIRAIRYPTVAKGGERLRICIHYNHTKKQLNELINLLKKYHR